MDPVLMYPKRGHYSRYLNGTDHRFTGTKIVVGTSDFFADMFIYGASSGYIMRGHDSNAGWSIYYDNTNQRAWVAWGNGTTTAYATTAAASVTKLTWHYLHIEADRSGLISVFCDSHDTAIATLDISGDEAVSITNPLASLYLGSSVFGDYFGGGLARVGIGVGALLTADERLAMRASGQGLLTSQIGSTTLTKFTHRWDLNKGGNPLDAVGSNDLTQSGATPIPTRRGPR